MISRTALLTLLALVLLGTAPALAGESKGPTELVHVPTDELDVLLKADRKGIVLRYAEYERLLEAAKARRAELEAQPPVDGTLVSCEGTIDLTPERAATMELTYGVEVLAEGPRSVAFPIRGFALERLLIQDLEGAPSGRYEEWNGRPRLRFEESGKRIVTAAASAGFARRGAQRFLDLGLPPASAMAFTLRFPPGVEGVVMGEGAAVPVRAPSDRPLEIRARPSRGGRLRVAFAPRAKGTDDGPAILDTRTNSLHSVGDGLIHSRVIVNADVFRTPVSQLVLSVPDGFAVRSLEGKGVTGFRRAAAGGRLTVDLAKSYLGTVVLVLEGERTYQPGPGVELPTIAVEGAVRHRAEMAVQFGRDVRVRGFDVTSGRRLPASRTKGQQHLIRYALTRESGVLSVDLEAGAVRLDAMSTYYLNLAEAGKTLLVTTTYRVLEGTVFALAPTMPGGYELRQLTINGKPNGFSKDLRADGTLEIALARGVPEGGEISLAATLEQSEADWVRDGEPQPVPFTVPAAGAEREEGLVAIGADAAFQVLETMRSDLVAVGAAELTARGISAAGLVYGYRLDGPKPAVALTVRRHEPVIDAALVSTLLPSPRRLDVVAVVAHRIRRAGVRVLHVDVPAWAPEDQVRFDSPYVRGATRLVGDARPDDVPAGYERWRVDLNQRVIGRHTTVVRYHDDLDTQNWRIAPERALGVRAPIARAERFVVVQRADGLEVSVSAVGADVRSIEWTELPAEAAVDPLKALEVLRLANGSEGVGVSVQKHDGAAVLAAVAERVHLRTAVAREGVLRTRAEVHLFNIDRQFLRVSLPPGSDLIGAVVDGQAVKVLADPEGALLVPIPTARKRTDLTVAALTYETKLGEALAGSLRVPGPVFHQLEVLRTAHEVAFDPDVHVAEVSGDYGRVRAPAPTKRRPWIADLFGGLSRGLTSSVADGAAPTSREATGGAPYAVEQSVDMDAVTREEEIQDRVETDNDLPYEESFGQAEGLMDAPFEGPSNNGTIGLGGGAGRRGRRADGPGGAVPPAAREPADMGPPTPAGPVSDPSRQPGADAPPPEPKPAASADDADARRPAGGRAHDHHEGDLPPADGTGRPRRRRTGLLSLDVPVILGPNVVVAQRLGSGGVIEIDLVTDEGSDTSYALFALVFLAVGLLAGYRRRADKLLVVVGGAALAVLLGMLFGEAGNTISVALADAVSLLALAWSVRWLIARIMQRGTKAHEAVESAASAGAAALLVAGLLLALAAPARADEPRPPVPDVKTPKKVYVPYDPADPTKARPGDRVFLPLDTYLKLFKAAHPEKDPELVELGRMVTIVDAQYAVRVARKAGAMARGIVSYRFAKRGQGTLLVRWPLGGLAVTKATLDGEPVRLLLEKGVYRVAVTEGGDHTLELEVRVPVIEQPDGRTFSYTAVPFARALLTVRADEFEGDVRVTGAGRVETTYQDVPGGKDCLAKAWLGHAKQVTVSLAERSPAELPTTVRTRAESRTIHSIRDDGTETQTDVTVHVLQGRAPFVDLSLPAGVSVLEAKGPRVVRWEALATPSPRLRLTFNAPSTGAVKVSVRSFRAAESPTRTETMPDLTLLDTTGENGHVIVNADPAMRVEIGETQNLFRIARPKGRRYAGVDGVGRVTGAWRFAARPSRLTVSTRRIEQRVDIDTEIAVVFGDDRVRTSILGRVDIDPRAPVGTLVFALPGEDGVRRVLTAGLDTWWLEGEGAERRLFVRYLDLRRGKLALRVLLERRLGGVRDGLATPRWRLDGARRDRGTLTLFALPDVELKAGSVPGLRSLPVRGRRHPATGIENARAVHVYAWDEPVGESLPVGLRAPETETEAVVVTLVSPGDEEHGVDHLVLFDVRRGLTDQLSLFVPDGAGGEVAARRDVVTTRDLREIRRERVTRRDADGQEVSGTLYDLRLQSPRDDVIEVTVSQTWLARDGETERPVRMVRPEGVAGTLWFSLVRTFLDGTIDVAPVAGTPDPANFEDLPFVPAGLTKGVVYRSYASREPYILSVVAQRHRLQDQAAAVVQAAVATAVLGMDGQARVRVDYRVFNRARQFLRLKLPVGARLFGATTAGEPVKPLAGKDGTILLPIPKVPLGGKGYPVSVLYRAEAGPDFAQGGAQSLRLPTVEDGVAVDRTVVRLYVPDGYEYDVESRMTATNASDVAADLAEVAVREARDLLKLAEKGTLAQRWAATQNGLALIAHARAKLNQAPEAWSRYRSLAGELNVLGTQLEKQAQVTRQDVQAARSQELQSGPSVEEFASNAKQIVALDDVTNGQRDEAGDAVAGKNKAAWRINPSMADTPEVGDAFGKVRARLKSKLQGRAQSESRKNFRNVLDQQKKGGKAATATETHSGVQLPTQTFDAKQVGWLNDNLKREQTRNRQLGAVDTSILNTLQSGQTMNDVPFEGPQANAAIGLVTRQDREAARLGRLALRSSNYGFQAGQEQRGGQLNPSAGAYFNDGEDGSYAGRTENLFDAPMQAGAGGGGVAGGGAGGDSAVEPYGKEGLMGVDVPLPRIGKVYYFRGLHAGAPIELSPSKAGASHGGRLAILLLILAAAGVVGVAIRRRARSDAA